MKKAIILLVIIMFDSVYSQHTAEKSDVIEGSSIRFNNFKSSKKEITNLFINRRFPTSKFGAFVNTANLYFPLKKSESKNSTFKQTHLKRKYGNFYTCNIFQFKKSGIDNSSQNLHFVYNNEIMTIRVKKNLAGVSLTFKEFIFKEGFFEIDFKKIVKEKLYKNNEILHVEHDIELDTFPFEEK